MKISLCIPQYNRINLLLKNLKVIEQQIYPHIEVVVSDDCSNDTTREVIMQLKENYKYPLTYFRFDTNQGYDRNYRKSIELATGEYAMVLGNDDTLNGVHAIENLIKFLETNNRPDIGYCNYVEENQPDAIIERALESKVYGSGIDIALKHYNGFSFVAGIIYKRSAFEKFNNSKHDGSIYAQMYLGLLMIASGCTFFTYKEPVVLKDIADGEGATASETYKNRIPKSWKDFRKADAGLPGVSHVLISAIREATGSDNPGLYYQILKRIYGVTFPYWIVQYKKYGSISAATGLILGLFPSVNPDWNKIEISAKFRLLILYGMMSVACLVTPSKLFDKLEHKLRKGAKH